MRARRTAALLAVLLAIRAASADTITLEAGYASLTKLLEKYVTSRGVRYTAWRGDGDDLKTGSAALAAFRGTDPKTLSPEERKAVWINLYNAKVLELVLLGNPKVSIRELSKGLSGSEIFARDTILYHGKGTSLDDVEKMLRTEFKDPRIHFALSCAARSCPPLRSEAYVPGQLDAQLDDAARSYLASPGAVDIATAGGRTTITVPKIFEWYADDFKAGGGALAFLAKYGPPEAAAAAATGKAKLAYAEYDWGLNAAP